MSAIINTIANFVQSVILLIGYPGIFAMQFIENIFPPFPTDTMLPFSGVVAASGRLNVVIVWLAAVLGSVTGSLLLYGVGKWADQRLVRNFIRRHGRLVGLSYEGVDKAVVWFNRYGAPVIVFGRLVPVMRSVISLTAGMSRMPILPFAFFTTLSSAGAMAFWIGVGYVLGENWRVLLTLVDQFEPFILLGIGVALTVGVLLLARRLFRGRTLVHEPGASAE
ncbi:MAG: DedA family protein [Anaerolineae bacterium]|nr:DedA family protein [Anaerolineae bacterium]